MVLYQVRLVFMSPILTVLHTKTPDTVNRFTRWSEVMALESIEAATLARALFSYRIA